MKIAEIIEQRKPEWKELEALVAEQKRIRSTALADPEKIARFTALYRSVCSDLALAESYQFPAETVQYLNSIVGKAYHHLYRTPQKERSNIRRIFFEDIPRSIFHDPIFWLSFVLFWGPFGICFFLCHLDSAFAEKILDKSQLAAMEAMYSQSFESMDFSERFSMVGFYIWNNGGIGLKCFAFGIIGGICGAYILCSNSIYLGVIFGFMSGGAVGPEISSNFTNFTVAHGPFELTAIIMSAAAGMKMGFAFFSTHGYRRFDSVRIAAHKAIPIMITAFGLFCLAAFLEAFVSPAPWLPLIFKQGIALISSILLFVYIVVLGILAQKKIGLTGE
ncbi:MAG: stage II sporulation protein M [Planctomycetia bacterium]|nr:stage II sporulation protein M [Planctomycetia bacterium]